MPACIVPVSKDVHAARANLIHSKSSQSSVGVAVIDVGIGGDGGDGSDGGGVDDDDILRVGQVPSLERARITLVGPTDADNPPVADGTLSKERIPCKGISFLAMRFRSFSSKKMPSAAICSNSSSCP
jgi:hypothetical protein